MLNFVSAYWSFPVVPAHATSNSSYVSPPTRYLQNCKGYSDKLSTIREVNYS